jgi:Protein of unknown function (DUF4231)
MSTGGAIMALSEQKDDPWDSPDPALSLATQQLTWYAAHRDRARITYLAGEVLLLLTTAATTLAAALQASPWVTATLAAIALVLTGLRKVFDSRENWIAFAIAWSDLRAAVNEHRLQGKDRVTEAAQRRLVATVNDIVNAETGRWATRRRTAADQHE